MNCREVYSITEHKNCSKVAVCYNVISYLFTLGIKLKPCSKHLRRVAAVCWICYGVTSVRTFWSMLVTITETEV
jgi:hypothetical protein